jgi:hypothetical protein
MVILPSIIHNKENIMNIRKVTSMTMLLSLVVLIVNSIVLYVVPEGRVAYWAGWEYLGLTKSDWSAQHTTVGFLFLVAGGLHIYYNWNPIVAYMKNKARQIKVFTGPFNVALALTVIFIVGTYYHVPPLSTIVEISEYFKNTAAEKYGEPPYGHAESSSLQMFTKRESIDLDKSLELLGAAGIEVTGPKDTIKDIAIRSKRSPQQIYEIIKPASIEAQQVDSNTGAAPFPDAPKSGWGKKTLAETCIDYGLDVNEIIAKLGEKGIKAEGDMAIKDIAAASNLEPMGVFEALQEIVTTAGK